MFFARPQCSAHYTLMVFTQFSASHQRLTSPTIHLSAIFHILRFMKGAFHFVPVQEAIIHSSTFLEYCTILDLHFGDIRSQNGQDHNCITGTSSATIAGPRNGGQRSRFELRVLKHGGFCGNQSFSKTHCTCPQRRFSRTKQRNQWYAEYYTGTNQGRSWSICCSVGFLSLGTRATGTQCYAYRQLKVTANGTLNGKRTIKPQDSSTQLWLQSCTSISGRPVKFTQLIKKSRMTAMLQNVHQFISMEALLTDERISTAERIMSYNQDTRTNKVCINFLGKFAVRLYVTKPVRCYRCQRFGHIAAACLVRTGRCSMCSGLHRTQECLTHFENSVTVTLKCANCGKEHSANSNRCPVLREKMQIKMNNATRKSRTTVSKPPPPLVTSGEFLTIPTRKKILTENLLKTGKSLAAISHVPRSVVLTARSSMRKTTNMTAFESACVKLTREATQSNMLSTRTTKSYQNNSLSSRAATTNKQNNNL